MDSVEHRLMHVGSRIGLWFVSLLLAASLFTLLLALFLGLLNGSDRPLVIFLIFRVTMIFGLAVWCLYLPVVIAIKDVQGRNAWMVLVTGSLIGPVSMALWDVILGLSGVSQEKIWHGDPLLGELGGAMAGLIFASIVGFLTTSIYIALSLVHRRSVLSRW